MKRIYLSLLAVILAGNFSYAQWTTSGSNIYYNSGNVGVGTTSPAAKLHINTSGTSSNVNGEYNGDLIIQGNTGVRSITNGATLEFVIPANTDGTNLWGQGRIITVAGNTANGSAVGKLILGTRRYFDKGAGVGLGWNYGDDLVIDGGGNVGIGTTSPAYKLDLYNGTAGSSLNITGAAMGTRNDAGIDFSAINGTIANYARIGLQISTGTLGSETGGLTFSTINSGTLSEKMFISGSGNVAIGTTDPRGYKLAVNGDAIATSMTVMLHSAWPDYVLKPAYKLPALSDVKTFIDKNHHLPDMPSESEVAKDGINLGEMNKLLTKKVEELTLYLIDLKKDVDDLKKENAILKQKRTKK